ncbi:MAG: protein tyrosine phosphatase [Legionellaceae bacterium]|nr:protein tyrosine phosphatase [Legionellaceae bacterium]
MFLPRTFLFFMLMFMFVFGAGHAASTNVSVQLGDTQVIVEKIQHGHGKAFVHVHQNETTALQAARAVIDAEGGSIVTLHHPGGRNIVFHLDKIRYEFDPNRMFTDAGIKKTLKQFGPYSTKAHGLVKQLARRVKTALPSNQAVIAVHNNQHYSLKEYYPGASLAAEAAALYVPQPKAFRNFYLVTQNADYTRLKYSDFNAVLQAPTPDDDGSLSVYLTSKPYVNVEAGYDQLAAQIKMLRAA